jgi:hypothetical protein
MEGIVAIFAGLGFAWFTWILLFVGFGFLAFSTYWERRAVTGIIGTAIIAIALYNAYGSGLFAYMWNNPLTLVKYVVFYFLIGSAWAMWRWIGLGGHAWKTRRRYDRHLRTFLNLSENADVKGKLVPEDKESEWIKEIARHDLFPSLRGFYCISAYLCYSSPTSLLEVLRAED